jgi:hypothetical protein
VVVGGVAPVNTDAATKLRQQFYNHFSDIGGGYMCGMEAYDAAIKEEAVALAIAAYDASAAEKKDAKVGK